MLQEIVRALLEADVNVGLVKTLRQNIKTQVSLADNNQVQVANSRQSGFNKRKLIQTTVIQEVKNVMDPGTSPYEVFRQCNKSDTVALHIDY